MAFSAPNSAAENQKHKELRWYENDVGVRTSTGYLSIHHDPKEQRLIFHSDGQAITPFKSAEDLIKVLISKTHRVFLEWCQVETGSYVYFNLGQVIQSVDESEAPHESIDVKLLILDNKKQKNADQGTDEKEADESNEQDSPPNSSALDESCYFDESVPIESKLNPTDILIISPLRSMHSRFTPMGLYEGHQLYLGPQPTVEFVNQCKVSYIMNCCLKGNAAEIKNKTDAKERLFNVAGWKWAKQYTFDVLEDGGYGADMDQKPMGQLAYLDAMIDEIHHYLQRGYILIHCLAGAHRSPFITGCYLIKYGLKGTETGQSPENIYVHMKGKRRIVQELGYDVQLGKYQKYLEKQANLEDEQ